MTAPRKGRAAKGEKKGRAPQPKGMKIDKDDLEEIDEKVSEYEAIPDTKTKLSEHDLHECISETMRYVLAHNHKKPGVPIPYTQISTFLKGLQSKQSGIAKPVITHVQKELLKLGWEMCSFKVGATIQYVLKSILPGNFMAEFVYTDQENSMIGLCLHMHLYLRAKGDRSTEEDMLHYLARYGLQLRPLKEQNKSTRADLAAQFGTASPIQALLDQKILKIVSEEGANGVAEEMYRLGDAAEGDAEDMSKEDIDQELQDLVSRD